MILAVMWAFFEDFRLLDDIRLKDGLAHWLLLMVKMSCGDGRIARRGMIHYASFVIANI